MESSPRYGEARYIATGYIGNRLHAVIYTMRDETIRIISLRPASWEERRAYDDH